MPMADIAADVTFRCHTGDYILLVYGRLPLIGPWTPGGWRLRAIVNRRPLHHAVPGRLNQGTVLPDNHQYFHTTLPTIGQTTVPFLARPTHRAMQVPMPSPAISGVQT